MNYLKTQKAVVRVSPEVPLHSIIPAICEKCEVSQEHIVLLRDGITGEELELTKSLEELGIKELYAWDRKRGELRLKAVATEFDDAPTILRATSKHLCSCSFGVWLKQQSDIAVQRAARVSSGSCAQSSSQDSSVLFFLISRALRQAGLAPGRLQVGPGRAKGGASLPPAAAVGIGECNTGGLVQAEPRTCLWSGLGRRAGETCRNDGSCES